MVPSGISCCLFSLRRSRVKACCVFLFLLCCLLTTQPLSSCVSIEVFLAPFSHWQPCPGFSPGPSSRLGREGVEEMMGRCGAWHLGDETADP